DFITMIHVIEHVTNPRHFIRDAANLLYPDGILYIETPNLESHLFHVEKNEYTFLTPPAHVWLFSEKSMRMLTQGLFSLEYISTYSYPTHLAGIIKRIIKKILR